MVDFAVISMRRKCDVRYDMAWSIRQDKPVTIAIKMLTERVRDELPSLSTGEALIVGRSITAPLLVKIGPKALVHGGESPVNSGRVGGRSSFVAAGPGRGTVAT